MGRKKKLKVGDEDNQDAPVTEKFTSVPPPDGVEQPVSGVPAVMSSEPEVKPRESYTGKFDFLLSCIGYAVGLGNVWRFPYLCYKNGGGAFLIPYAICLVTSGIPVFFLEIAMGQFMSEGCVTVWKMCPLWKGIGYGTMFIIGFLNVYYIVVLAWALLYLFHSFQSPLPWSTCDNLWNTDRCKSSFDKNGTAMTNSSALLTNVTANLTTVDPAVEFWERKILRKSTGIDDVGVLNWDLALTLLLAWLMIYFIIFKGVHSSGKVVYFTATFPYVVITILLVRGVTLDGAADGIIFYLKPNFTKLMEAEVWMDAGTQIFFSYAIATGALIALGSYNAYNNNVYKDCAIIACINSCTSMYAGFAIFSVLGFMAHEQGVHISEVAEQGPGLAFIAYPKAVTLLPGAPAWAILFFFVIILLGLDSQFVGVEGLVTALVDMYPTQLRVGRRKEMFVAVVCFVTFLVGLSMVTEGGVYVFHLFNNYASSGFCLIWFCFFECVVIAYSYGHERFYQDITHMIGFRINPWMKVSWMALGPIVCVGIFFFSLATHSPLKYGDDYRYPVWADVIGFMLALSSMLWIPGYCIYAFATTTGTFMQRYRYLVTPRWSLDHPRHKGDSEFGVPMMPVESGGGGVMPGKPAAEPVRAKYEMMDAI